MDESPPAAPTAATAPTTTAPAPSSPGPSSGASGPNPTGSWGAPGDTWESEDTLLSWKLIGGILAVLFVVGFACWKLFGTSSRPTDAAKAPAANAAAGNDGAGGANGAPTPTAAGPDDVTDAFTGASTTGLGTTDTGQAWETPTGTWGKADGHAYVVTPNAEGGNRSIAVVDLGSGNGRVHATVGKAAPGWGLVFRYQGPFNYWVLLSSPKFGTYNLVKMEDGKATSVGNSGLAKQEAGTVVGVTFQGPRLGITVDGKELASFQDAAFANATKVGLVAGDQTSADAQWQAFGAAKLGATPPADAGATPTTTAKAGG